MLKGRLGERDALLADLPCVCFGEEKTRKATNIMLIQLERASQFSERDALLADLSAQL